MKRKTKPDADAKIIKALVPRELAIELKARAAREERTIQEIIIDLVRQYLKTKEVAH